MNFYSKRFDLHWICLLHFLQKTNFDVSRRTLHKLYTIRCLCSYFDLLMGLGGFPLVFPFTLDLVGVPSTSNSSSTRLSMVTLATCTLPSRVNLSTLSPSTTGSLPDLRTENIKCDIFLFSKLCTISELTELRYLNLLPNSVEWKRKKF